MTVTRSRRLTVLAVLGALAFALSTPIAAAATPLEAQDTLQDRVDVVLAEFPGGTQTAVNEIAWEGGTVVLTLEVVGGGITPLAVGSCATGAYCAYTGYSLSGNKLTLWTCGTTYPTTALGAVRSVANARSSGYVQAKNSSGSVLATINAGGSNAFAPSNITQLTCVS